MRNLITSIVSRLAIAATIAVASLHPATATAQSQDETDGGTLALGVLFMGISTGVGVLSGYSTWGTGDAKDSRKKTVNAQYIQRNYASIQQDLTTGQGLTIVELANAVGLPHTQLDDFGIELRRQRRRLLSLIPPSDLDDHKVARFLLEVEAIADTVDQSFLAKHTQGQDGVTLAMNR